MNLNSILKFKVFFILSLGVLFTSCERITFEEHAIESYDGKLKWVQETKKADWPKRYDHESVVFNDKMWVVGGYNFGLNNQDSYLEDVWSSADGKTWTLELENAPWKGRRGHSLVTFNDGNGEAMYLIGGFSTDEESGYRAYNNDVWKSTDGKTWEQIKGLSTPPLDTTNDWFPRMHHKCIVANFGGIDYIYLIGGRNMQPGFEGRYATTYFNDVWRSADGINWERIANTDFGVRSEHAAIILPNGKMLIQGGMHGVIFNSEGDPRKPISDWHHLWTSEDGINWNKESDFGKVNESYLSRSGHEMVFYKDKVWVLPGKTTSNNHFHFTEWNHYPTWTYDINGEWGTDSKGTAIDARHSYSALIFNDKIWVLGGNTNKHGQSNDVWSATLKK